MEWGLMRLLAMAGISLDTRRAYRFTSACRPKRVRGCPRRFKKTRSVGARPRLPPSVASRLEARVGTVEACCLCREFEPRNNPGRKVLAPDRQSEVVLLHQLGLPSCRGIEGEGSLFVLEPSIDLVRSVAHPSRVFPDKE